MPLSDPNQVTPARVDPSKINPAPLTRRELREQERTRIAMAAADPLDGPAMALPGDSILPRFAATQVALGQSLTSPVELVAEAPIATVEPEVPVVVMAATALPTTALPTPVATPAPVLPSRRALRLAAQAAVTDQAVQAESEPTPEVLTPVELIPAEPIPAELIPAEPTGHHGSPDVSQDTPVVVVPVEQAATIPSRGSLRGDRVPAAVSQPMSDSADHLVQAEARAATESWVETSAENASTTRRQRRSARPKVEKHTAPLGRPAIKLSATRPPAGPARRPERSRARRILAKGFPLVAMTFVAGLMIATSTPAAALLSQADIAAQSVQAAEIEGAPNEVPQSYTASSGDTLSVDRDGFETSSVQQIAQQSGIRMEATFTNDPNGTIQWPFPVGVHIGDRFGYRDCFGCSSNHHGQDFNPGDGAPVQSIADGVVRVADDGSGSLGVHMIIDHEIDGRLVSSVYAHMQHDSMEFQAGDAVKVGDEIGITGTTGMSTGPHLHFEIRLDGVTNVDPLEWLYSNTN